MPLTCFIRYQIDPFQREAFRAYAGNWGHIIPRCGGHLLLREERTFCDLVPGTFDQRPSCGRPR